MSSRLDQSTDARLAEIKDVIRSGVTELTGKAQRFDTGSGIEHGRRFGGGIKKAFPELRYLKQQPGVIAKAIERGKGKVYRQVRSVVRSEMSRYVPESRKRVEKPVVPAHRKLTSKCQTCGRLHGKGEHRFHGEGAYHRTHLFSFNPMKKNTPKRPIIRLREILQSGTKWGSTAQILLRRTYWTPEDSREADRIIREFTIWQHRQEEFQKKNPVGKKPSYQESERIRRKVAGAGFGYLLGIGYQRYDPSTGKLERYKTLEEAYRHIQKKNARVSRGASRSPKRATLRKNPTEGLTKIYGRVLRVEAQKTQVHRCDPGCAKARHCYYHDFESKNVNEFGLPAGSEIKTPDGYIYVIPEKSLLLSTKVRYK
jgi:hypothetical protein